MTPLRLRRTPLRCRISTGALAPHTRVVAPLVRDGEPALIVIFLALLTLLTLTLLTLLFLTLLLFSAPLCTALTSTTSASAPTTATTTTVSCIGYECGTFGSYAGLIFADLVGE